MFVHYSLRTDVGLKAIATLVATALVLWVMGAHFIGTAEAAPQNVTNFSDTISDSAPSAAASHSLSFALPNGATDDQTIIIEFDAAFTVSPAALADIEVDVATVPVTVDATGAGVAWAVATSGQQITLTVGSGGVASSTVVDVRLGAIAGGSDFITNPAGTTTSYTVDILPASTIQDSGQTRVAITDLVLVTAEVPTTFDFVVNGTPAGFTIPGVATTTSTSTNSISLPFEVLTADISKTLAHQLNVTTNAANGFVVTVEQSQDLQSSTGAIIDSFTDGTYVNSPIAWAAPGDNIAQDNTWGHWGLTSDDNDYFAGVNDRWIAASTTSRVIFQHASSSDGVTDDVGSTTIGYQIQITPLQEAGNDYNTTLTYIATPTF